MRLLLLFMLAGLLHVSAATNAQTVTLKGNHLSFDKVLQAIRQQTGYTIFTAEAVVKNTRPISVDAKNMPVDQFLETIFTGLPLEAVIEDKTIIIKRKNKPHTVVTEIPDEPEAVQQRAVSGQVTDSDGNPLEGVTVRVDGTNVATTTDTNGRYELRIPDEGTALSYSIIGFVSVERTIGSQSVLDVSLEASISDLDEVIVVGYGTQKKVNMTGAVSSIDYSDQAATRPITTVSNALAGLAAGVQVMQGSGEPGRDGSGITVRGVGTLNSTAPLVLIDGMIGDMDVLNPQDIESISILKDAASSAIYGVRAANGVILITTKKGRIGKPAISYMGRSIYNQPTNLLNFVSNYADYMELINESRTNINQASLFAPSTIALWREKSQQPHELNENGVPNYVAFPNVDWQDVIFNHGLTHDHSISASGGGEMFRYYMSVGYLDNPGIVENTGMTRYAVRSNIESNLNKWLTVGLRIYGTLENKDPGSFGSMNGFTSQIVPGVYPEYQGQLGYAEAVEESGPTARNLLQRLHGRDGYLRNSLFNTTLYSRVSFLKDFSWDFNLNYERANDEQRTWTNSMDLVKLSNGEVMLPGDGPADMTTYFSNINAYSYTLENLLRYDKTYSNLHDVSVLLGYQEYYFNRFNNNATKKGLVDQSVNVPSSATIMQSIAGGLTENATRSVFGRVNYAYDSRYLFEANFRYDGSSRFYKNNRWGFFPSFSAGWVISEENFMSEMPYWFEFLKLRASWGQLGNNSVGDYPYQSTYSISNAVINSDLVAGLASRNVPNYLLSWEKTAVSNIGLEANFLNSRLQFEGDIYRKITDGILFRPTIYLTLGDKTAPMMNIAEVTNKGVELRARWQDKRGDLSYSVAGSFAYNHNEVTKYQGQYEAGWYTDNGGNSIWNSNLGKVSTGDDMRVVEGKMVNEFYMGELYQGTGSYYNADGSININGGPKDGMIRTEDDMAWLHAMIDAGYTFMPYQTIAKDKIWYGDVIYADINGDGYYGNTYDQTFRGASNVPKVNFGLQAAVSYKAFDLSMIWAGAAGFYRYSTAYTTTATGVGYAINSAVANDHYFYDPENPNDPRTNIYATYGRLTNSSSYQNLARSTMYLFKGDYLKLKNLTLGYSFPKHWLSRLTITNARFFVSGDNLLSFNDFPGMDPELGASPTYTSIKTYALGLNVTF